MTEAVAVQIEKNYLNQKQGILSWLLTTDHKRIAILYTFSITGLFLPGRIFRADDAPGTPFAAELAGQQLRRTTSCLRCTGSSWSGSF